MSIFSMIGSIAGAAISAWGANKVAKTQAAAARHAVDLQHSQYRQSREDMMPWLEAGRRSLADLEADLGSTYEASEGYKWRVQEGEKAALSNLAALGMTNSGQALKRLTEYRMGLAAQDHDQWANRKAALAGAGQTQSSSLASLGQNYANNAGNMMWNAGAARASGYAGMANAVNRGIEGVTGSFGMMAGRAGGSHLGASPTWSQMSNLTMNPHFGSVY